MEKPASDHPAGDRRPIASRNLPIWQLTAHHLARIGISANGISVAGMFAGIAGAICLLLTSCPTATHTRLLFLTAAACIQLRLLANMLDGMVAIASRKTSVVGELFNEIPDRISDTLILAGAGYAVSSDPALGWAAASLALFVTYIRSVGKGVGVSGLFQGPMSKSHRMFTLTLTCLYLAFVPATWQPLWQLPWPKYPVGIMALALEVIILGCLITAFRRLRRIIAALRERR